MKWVNGYTAGAISERMESWHRWFAWHPVCVSETKEGRQIKVWWEWIERKNDYWRGNRMGKWSYREIGHASYEYNPAKETVIEFRKAVLETKRMADDPEHRTIKKDIFEAAIKKESDLAKEIIERMVDFIRK